MWRAEGRMRVAFVNVLTYVPDNVNFRPFHFHHIAQGELIA